MENNTNNTKQDAGIKILVVALLALIGFGIAAFVMGKSLEGCSLIVGALIATVTDLKGYFWGSSEGSKSKDAVLSGLMTPQVKSELVTVATELNPEVGALLKTAFAGGKISVDDMLTLAKQYENDLPGLKKYLDGLTVVAEQVKA
jgi:hypothetical protein